MLISRERSGIQLGYPFLHSRLYKYGRPWIIQPKLEGDRRRVIFDDLGNVSLMTSTSSLSFSTPHIQKACETLQLRNIELDGEVYKHLMPHEEIRKRSAPTKNIHPDHESLELHIFDVILTDTNGLQRQEILDNLATLFQPPLFRVATHFASDEASLESWYKSYIDQQYEGIIIRNPNGIYDRRKWWGGFMKLKPKDTEVFLVIGYKQETTQTGEAKNALGSLILRGLGSEFFSVGTGFTRKQRELLWQYRQKLSNKLALIKFQDYTVMKQVPKMTSFVGFVVDGECLPYPWKE